MGRPGFESQQTYVLSINRVAEDGAGERVEEGRLLAAHHRDEKLVHHVVGVARAAEISQLTINPDTEMPLSFVASPDSWSVANLRITDPGWLQPPSGRFALGSNQWVFNPDRSTTGAPLPRLKHVLDGKRVQVYQELVRRIPVPDHIYEFAAHLVRRTRPSDDESPEWAKPLIGWGAGPRAVQYLILGAKSRAALLGSYMVRLEDIIEVAEPVMTHRVITSFGAETDGVTSQDIVRRLVDELVKEK